MKYSVAAIVALGAVPAHSLSYLDSISGVARPAISAPALAPEPPFFFTDGAKDDHAETPDFFFTDGPGAAAPPAASAPYLDALNSPVSTAPTGSGMSSYLEALPSSPSATAPSGSGMASYLNALPQNAAPSVSGAGLSSYADSMGGGAATAPTPYTPEPAAIAQPYASSESSGPVATGGNYLEALASVASSGSPTGGGLTGYLEALPRAASAVSGAGIQTYTDALPVSNTVAGSGSGMATYADNLSPSSASGKSSKPFTSKPTAPVGAFAMGSQTGQFDFSVQADEDLIAQLEASQGQRVTLSGTAFIN